jgi:hypothetical protein
MGEYEAGESMKPFAIDVYEHFVTGETIEKLAADFNIRPSVLPSGFGQRNRISGADRNGGQRLSRVRGG